MNKYLMSMTVLSLFICQLSFSAQIDSTTFFSSIPESYTCAGSKEVFNEETKPVGNIHISILGKDTQSPIVELKSEDGKIHYKIGDGFLASLKKHPDNCGYHFASNPLRMFYVCGLEVTNPASYLQVTRADRRVSFSQELICTGGSICIRMSACR